MAELVVIKKKQPIPKGSLENLQEFLHLLAAKDVRSFSLSFVLRDGEKHHMCANTEDNYNDILCAIDYGRSIIVRGGD